MGTLLDPEGMDANQQALVAELARIRRRLEDAADASGPAASRPVEGAPAEPIPAAALASEAPDGATTPALDLLRATFGLSAFEADLLLLCAGVELDAGFAAACAAAPATANSQPTFALALSVLNEPHWSAFAPDSPLRRWRMVEVEPGPSLTRSPLRIDERVLHHLAGFGYLDGRLAGIVEPMAATDELPPSQAAVADRVAAAWAEVGADARLPVVQLTGPEPAALRAIAAEGCASIGLGLHVARASALPVDARERDALARLWEREAVLAGSALLIDLDDPPDSERRRTVQAFLDGTSAALMLAAPARWRIDHRAVVALDVPAPPYPERLAVWRECLDDDRVAGRLAAQFDLAPSRIRAVCAESASGAEAPEEVSARIWDAARREARPRLEDLAQRLEPRAGWDDRVLPAPQLATLREVAAQVQQRHRVHDDWGFADRSERGLGISALFAGPSGTGKTLAAEVLAHALRLDLYRIDLSQVVNKYIGETEKNLRRVFDAAEAGGAVLFFDEADALFGKRSEVRDSHDRYANIEVSYLLQRMEAYRGLAILATNLKDALDSAFLRRIRFVVHFPFPDAGLRAEIWRRVFPDRTPLDGLEVHRLARLNVAGGSIRNIALNAAFLAAAEDAPVGMAHLARSARGEYAKLEKALTEAELVGWNGGAP